MATRKVSIWIRFKQGDGWVVKPAQWAANRRNLVPGRAKGAREDALEYRYYLRYQRNGKRVMEPAGRDSIATISLANTREIELFAAERGVETPQAQVAPTNARESVADAAEKYLERVASGCRRSTYFAYRNTLEQFQEVCAACVFLDQINVDTLREFLKWMRAEEYDQDTIYVRHSELTTFLASKGINVKLPKTERPKRRVVAKDGSDIDHLVCERPIRGHESRRVMPVDKIN
jgi:Phage integrase, N-terminal SAM-like domain